jgi:hypothetical protein
MAARLARRAGDRDRERRHAQSLADYDLTSGHLWTLVLAWLALGPLTVRRLAAFNAETRHGGRVSAIRRSGR